MGHIIHESASYALTELFGHFSREADGVTAIVIDPGWVKTDMGGRNARLEPE